MERFITIDFETANGKAEQYLQYRYRHIGG